MTEQPTPNVDQHLTRMFTRDVVDTGGQIIRRLSTHSRLHIESRLIELQVNIEQLREAAGRL